MVKIGDGRRTWDPALLLADPSPCLRYLVLRDLLGRKSDDPESQEVLALRESDPLVLQLVMRQLPDGAWADDEGRRGPVATTTAALLRLGFLGIDPGHTSVRRGVEFLFKTQCADGSWPLPKTPDSNPDIGYDMIPLQTALPLRALAVCGYATDPRSQKAYRWLLDRRLDDGAWPTGRAQEVNGFVAGYRRLAHSRWGCRSNTTGALLCLAEHPELRHGPEARRALDLLLGRETREAPGFEVARIVGQEPQRGFMTYHGRFDPGLVLRLCVQVGATTQDARVAELVQFVGQRRGRYGMWEYPDRQAASRWVTYDLLFSLARVDSTGDWISSEARTPFQPYPRRRPRY